MATHPRLRLLPADRAGRVTYQFRTVIVLVARQNSKTLLMIVLALWHVYALKSRTVIGTAQDLANAEKAWAGRRWRWPRLEPGWKS